VLIHAVSNELESALEDALRGSYLGGYEFDEETGTSQQRELDI
jgi:hypothetical protein